MKIKKLITLLTIAICLCINITIAFANSEAGNQEHEESEQVIELNTEQIKQIGLETAIAGPDTFNLYKKLSGQVAINRDKIAYVVPRVEGIVINVKKQIGDTVKKDEIVAVLESRKLAELKAAYLAACAKYDIAEIVFTREENLWGQKISSEQDYLESKYSLTQAKIDKEVAEYNLMAIGFEKSYINNLGNEAQQNLTQYEIKAPFQGTIIEKNIVLGELVNTESIGFVISDMNTVWVDLQVYPSDLTYLKKGQIVTISSSSEIPDTNGVISYISPILNQETRTALTRVLIPNDSGLFRPGLFVTAQVGVSKKQVNIAIRKDSIQTISGEKCVFIKDEHGFEPVFVEVGLEDTNHVEILSGLSAGQEYVTKGAFALKSKIITSTLGSHAGHGH